jgi:hypothetical protein
MHEAKLPLLMIHYCTLSTTLFCVSCIHDIQTGHFHMQPLTDISLSGIENGKIKAQL